MGEVKIVYSKDITPMCIYCIHSKTEHNNNYLCKYKGVVAFDFSCKKYSYDATKRIPPKKHALKIEFEQNICDI